MLDLFEAVIETLNSILPGKDSPFRTWVLKMLVISAILGGGALTAFYVLKDTPFGQSRGLSPPTVTKILQPTVTEYAYTHRYVVSQLSTFIDQSNRDKGAHPNTTVSGIFLVSIYNKIINDYNPNKVEDNNDLFVWASDLQSIRTPNDLDNLDYVLNRERSLVFNSNITEASTNKSCIVGATPYSLMSSLAAVLKTKAVNYYSLCGIPDRSGNFIVALTMTFFNTKDDMEANLIAYRQQQTTINIGRVFSKYTIGYTLNTVSK